MARKKSIQGRKRNIISPQRATEKVAKRIRKLKASGNFGRYASKKIQSLFKSENIKFKRNRIKLDWKKLKPIQVKKYYKVFTDFLKAKTSTESGIEEKRLETREKLADTLSGLADERVSDEDIDDFYEMVKDDDFRYIADKIGDSDFYVLLNETKKEVQTEGGNANEILKEKLEEFMVVTNSSDAYNKVKNMYDKWFSS